MATVWYQLKNNFLLYLLQQALRLFAFRQIHKVLGIEPLKPNTNRKRRAENSDENASTEPAKVAKKDE